MELVVAGTSATIAGAICNPLEVVKIRMQLQGELKARGQYAVHYRNVFHAFYTIASRDGVLALQKGLVPFCLYQFSVNSVRLGLFQVANQKGLTRNSDGTVNGVKTLCFSTLCGVLGGVTCSPFYLVKTHLQSKANVQIAVGHQHPHEGTLHALRTIYGQHGFTGLWRGVNAMVPRVAIATATQLTTFEMLHQAMKRKFGEAFYWTPLCLASFGTGFGMTVTMAPFDVIATRYYNQGMDSKGNGLYYSSALDCAAKTFKKEGFFGFYKGWTACYFRMGPYVMLVFVIWDKLKAQHVQYLKNKDLK